VRFFHEHIDQLQKSMGMVIHGQWIAEHEDDRFVWFLQFESEPERVRLYAEVYESDHWKNDVAPHIPAMLDRERMVITRLEPATVVTG
jgi:hypothetical protein